MVALPRVGLLMGILTAVYSRSLASGDAGKYLGLPGIPEPGQQHRVSAVAGELVGVDGGLPKGGGRVAVRASVPLPETAYVRQRPFKDSLRVKKNGGSERFFDKDVDAFFINNE